MGLLRDQAIPTIFQGVSRQPDSIRFPGQVEDALNVTFSVETGGFSKRLGTTILTQIGNAADTDYRLHLVSRSSTEKYAMIHTGPEGGNPGSLRVFDLADGSEKTINIDDPADADFFDKAPGNFEFLSVLDYTFIVDRTQTVSLLPAEASDTNTYASMQMTKGHISGKYEVTITHPNGDYFKAWVTGGGSISADDVVENLGRWETRAFWEKSVGGVVTIGSNTNGVGPCLIDAKLDATWEVSHAGTFIYIKNTAGVDFTVDTSDPHGEDGWVVTRKRVTDSANLTARSFNGHKVVIKKSTDVDGYWLKFVTDDPNDDFGVGVWDETVPDGTQTKFDNATMPRALSRQEDGTFLLERIEWNEKRAGGDDLVPPPEFVDNKISDIVFRANRLGFLSGETVYFSAAGDYYRFWPDSGVEIVATDPFGLTNSTNQVSEFRFGVPFRRSLFIMSGEAQFEAYGDPFAPDTGRLEVATQYPANENVRPVVVGDEMYFVSEIGKDAMLYSYVYNDDTVSEIALEVSKHVRGFIKGPVVSLVAGALNSEVYILSDADRSSLYLHKFYYEGRDRVQSSWSRYSFPNSTIKSVGYQSGNLWLLIERNDGNLYLEYLPSVQSDTDEYDIPPRLDRQVRVLGTYDGVSDTTSWDIGYNFQNPLLVTTNKFPEGDQFVRLSVERAGNILTASGDWSSSEVVIGEEFPAHVTLSKQYMREGDQAMINGRLQLRVMTLRYEDAGEFTVTVHPSYRATRSYTMSTNSVGAAQIQPVNLKSGNFRFLVNSNAETVDITISGDTYLPFTITSAAWIGFFNEISRQDNG